VVVENKPGAGGQIGVSTLAASPADGSRDAAHALVDAVDLPLRLQDAAYKPLEDVQPCRSPATSTMRSASGPPVPASVKTIKDFLAWGQGHPGKANYGSPGAGSMPHLIVGLLAKLTGADLKHVPYRGSAPGIQDLLGGQISAMSSPVGDYLPYLKSGRLRPAGHLGPEPQPVRARRADVPAAGLPDHGA
jgi:tripartite-type tricarboxylate transporter receptor subunit TctC